MKSVAENASSVVLIGISVALMGISVALMGISFARTKLGIIVSAKGKAIYLEPCGNEEKPCTNQLEPCGDGVKPCTNVNFINIITGSITGISNWLSPFTRVIRCILSLPDPVQTKN